MDRSTHHTSHDLASVGSHTSRACRLWDRFPSVLPALLLGMAILTFVPKACHAQSGGTRYDPYSQRSKSKVPKGFNSPSIPRNTPAPLSKSAPADPLIDVVIEGNATIPASAIYPRIKTRPGRPASEAQILEDVRSLHGTRWFYSVEPVYQKTDQGLVLVFRVLERPIVRKVEFVGNKKIKTKFLMGLTNLKPGSAFSLAVNKECVRRIREHYRDKGYRFAEVSLRSGGQLQDRDVIFDIKEGPKVQVASIKLRGNKAIRSEILKLHLTTSKRLFWYFGGNYDPTTVPDDIASLRQYYHAIGYFDCDVTEKVEFNKSKSLVTLTYEINEGTRYKVGNILINGNEVLLEQDLRADFELEEGQFFKARDMNNDLEELKAKYGALGRLMTEVDAEPVFSTRPGVVDISYNIDEDIVRRIGKVNVQIRGENPHTKETVAINMLKVHPGDLADPALIRRTKATLAGSPLFASTPGLAPEIQVRPVRDATRYTKSEGLAGTFRGQSRTEHNEILNQHFRGLKSRQETITTDYSSHPTHQESPVVPNWVPPGAGYSRLPLLTPATQEAREAVAPAVKEDQKTSWQEPIYEMLDWSEQTVFLNESQPLVESNGLSSEPVIRAQNFDNFNAPPNPIYNQSPQGDVFGNQIRRPEPEGFVDLDITVTEERTGRFMIGAGVNSDSGVVGNIVLEEQNFNLLRFPRSFRDILEGYAWRGGGQQFRLEAVPGDEVSRYMVSWTDPYFLNTDYSFGVSGFYYNRFFRDWEERRLGGRLTLGRLISRDVSISGSVRLEDVEIGSIQRPAPSLLAVEGNNFLGTGKFSTSYDTRDSAFLASEGWFAQASVEQAFGDFDFTKLEGQLSKYFTVYERADGAGKQTLSLNSQIGWTTDDTPVFERFYAGGFQTFRGFEFRGVTPREVGARVGGQFMFLGSAEYMIPITANEMFRGVLFTDFGTVDDNASLDKFRLSVGGGLRITVPQMGPVPIALDWAIPVVKEDEDNKRIFSFYIGFTR